MVARLAICMRFSGLTACIVSECGFMEGNVVCRSEDQGQMTPFAYGAQQANMTFGGGRPYLGGKPDDITVVVGLVTGASKL
jgi:hypothetical protein